MKLSEKQWQRIKIIGFIPLVIFVPGWWKFIALIIQGAAAFSYIKHEQRRLENRLKDLDEDLKSLGDDKLL